MKKLLLLLTLSIALLTLNCFAQNKNIDSLLILLKTDKPDTNKVIHSNKLSRAYIDIGLYDTALFYGNVSLQLSQQLNFKKGIASSCGNIGIVYKEQGDYPKALSFYFKALKIVEELSDKNRIAVYLGNIGNIYKGKGDYSEAMDYYLKALKIDEELGNKNGIARHLGNIGVIYRNQGDYPKALDNYLKALKIAEELRDKDGVTRHLGNIGNVYFDQKDYAKALDYYLKALKMANGLGNKNYIESWIGNIGNVYYLQASSPFTIASHNSAGQITRGELYSRALDYYLKALKMAEELGDKNGIARHLGNIGGVYKDQGDYPKAFEYSFKALKMDEKLGNKNLMAIVIASIGSLYTTTGKFKEAEQYLKRAITMNDSVGALNESMQNYESISQLYDTIAKLAVESKQLAKAIENYKLSSTYYKKAIVLKDTLFSQENKKQLVRKEMNYQFDKKEAFTKTENQIQQKIAEEKNYKQKIIIWSIASGLLLVVVLAGFIFRSLRTTRMQKQIIEIKSKETEEQKKVIEEQKIVVEEKNKNITDSINYAKRIQRAMLPHRKDIWAAFPSSFVLFKPKDIVSGDFYFFHKAPRSIIAREERPKQPHNGNKIVLPESRNDLATIAIADCTGHGVPGAFMSMVGAGKLNDAVSESSNPSEILSLLNKGIKTALKQSDSLESTRDGMDIALCSINTENCIVKYAGANRPLWVIRRGQTEVEEIKAT